MTAPYGRSVFVNCPFDAEAAALVMEANRTLAEESLHDEGVIRESLRVNF